MNYISHVVAPHAIYLYKIRGHIQQQNQRNSRWKTDLILEASYFMCQGNAVFFVYNICIENCKIKRYNYSIFNQHKRLIQCFYMK